MKRSDCQYPSHHNHLVTLGDWLNKARSALRKMPGEPYSSLYALAAHTLDRPTFWIQAHPEYILDSGQETRLDMDLVRLLDHEPLAYITGIQAFYGLDFRVNPHVLIPRPETESLVSNALDWLKNRDGECLIADVGTGSGCIAIAIAKNYAQAHFIATDVSYKSLQAAQLNYIQHDLEDHIDFLQADLLCGLRTQFDMICANLPYIPTTKLDKLDVAKFEPRKALDGGAEGLDLISRLLTQAQALIKPDGLILLEMECSQAQAIQAVIHDVFPKAGVKIIDDLGELPRLVKIEM